MGNRLSGPFPKVLTRITTLRNLYVVVTLSHLFWFMNCIRAFIKLIINLSSYVCVMILVFRIDFFVYECVDHLKLCRSLEGNQFSGPIPPDIGKLVHLEKLLVFCSLSFILNLFFVAIYIYGH